jgi:hypothetical protein
MRLSKERVRHMAEALVARLVQDGHVALTGTSKSLVDALDQAVTDELSVEDRLNNEVDYQKMFTMIKQKLVRERGIIL